MEPFVKTTHVQYLGTGLGLIEDPNLQMNFKPPVSSLWGRKALVRRTTSSHYFVQFDDMELGFYAFGSHGLPREDCTVLTTQEDS